MKAANIIYIAILLLTCGFIQAQELSNKYIRPTAPIGAPYNSLYIINEGRLPLYLPEVEGYTLLKCDLHTHTIFSDAAVWPTTRIEEAFREGLDAIALTDHFEFRFINRADVNTDNLMREYEIAKPTADELGILLVPGLEITREVPTGHFNILFIDDPSPLMKYVNKDNPRDPSNIEEILTLGKELGGFTTWNHPAYQMPDGAEWGPIHQSLYEKGLFKGIEIINSNLYVPIVHKWADEKGLTKMANTDWHSNIRLRDGWHRATTIVFAKERSLEALKEALFERRTVGYTGNYMYGEQQYLEPIFRNSLQIRKLSETDKKVIVELRNTSGMPYEIIPQEDHNYTSSRINAQGVVIYGNETVGISMDKKNKETKREFQVKVNNLHVKAGEPLLTSIKFD